MTFDLNMHVARLLAEEPFYAALSRHVTKSPTTMIPTAGVRVNPHSGRFDMLYNADFFSKLTDAEIRLVLIHEFLHLVLGHVTERMPAEGMTKRWNYATDAAINSEIFPAQPRDDIKKLYAKAILPEKLKMPRGKSAEWYFKSGLGVKGIRIPGGQPSDGEGGEGDSDGNGEGFDSHNGWSKDGKIPEAIKELARQRLKGAISSAAQQSMKGGWGTVSSSMRQEIIDRITPKVDWKSVLRYFVKTSQRSSHQSSVKKINRRYPYIHSGRKTLRTAKIAIAIDQSGSVSDMMLSAFYSELNKLAEVAEFTVVPFDTVVDDNLVYIWKKNERKAHERVMCGGTDFNAPARYINERSFDGCIVLTDMYAEKPINSKCTRLWMTDSRGAKDPYFTTHEKVVAIDY